MQIPLVNLKAQNEEILEDVLDDIRTLASSGKFIGGDHCTNFEKQFSNFSNSNYCIGVANGTDALELALKALNLSSGDEIILPANSFFASYEAVVNCGLIPRLVDVCEDNYLIDVEKVKSAINDKTRVVMGVNLYGNCCDLKALREIVDQNNLFLVLDCAQGHGSYFNNEPLTKYAHLVTYSFYPGKNLGAWGDAGAVCTNETTLRDRIKSLSNHGRLFEKYQHNLIGVNSRLDNLQAAVLCRKLQKLKTWTDNRQKMASIYNNLLSKYNEIKLPKHIYGNASHVYHLYVVRLIDINRDQLFDYLNSEGIAAGLHYPVPINLQPGYVRTGFDFFPVSEKLSKEIISLPLCAHITENEIKFICKHVGRFLEFV